MEENRQSEKENPQEDKKRSAFLKKFLNASLLIKWNQ